VDVAALADVEVPLHVLVVEASADLLEVAFVLFLLLHEALYFPQKLLLLLLELLAVLLQLLLLLLEVLLGVLGVQHFLVLLQIQRILLQLQLVHVRLAHLLGYQLVQIFVLADLHLRPLTRQNLLRFFASTQVLLSVGVLRHVEFRRAREIKVFGLADLVPLLVGSGGGQLGGAIDFSDLMLDFGLQVLQQNILAFEY
jgi:hypothetical protein